MKPTLLVLAAGMGSRYGGLKQIDPVGPSGEIIIDYSIYDAVKAGFGKVVFVIRHDIEKDFREFIGTRYQGFVQVEYVFQELDKIPAGFSVPAGREKPWGTGHAILMAKDAIAEPFAAINADDYYGQNAYQLLGDYLVSVADSNPAQYGMCGFVLRNTLSDHGTVSRGICETDEDGSLVDVEEITKIEKLGNGARYFRDEAPVQLSGDEIVSMNMWGFTPNLFEHLERQFCDFLEARREEAKSEFFIPTVVNNLIKSGKARTKVLETRDPWFGITYREDKPKVVASLKKLTDAGLYPEKLF